MSFASLGCDGAVFCGVVGFEVRSDWGRREVCSRIDYLLSFSLMYMCMCI